MQYTINDQVKQKLEAARTLILKEVRTHYSITELSKMVNLAEPTLKSGFKQLFGNGPFKYLTVARLERATELITTTDLPVSEIARHCGYNHATNMTAAFRRHYNKLPSDLRKHPVQN
jgi:AraC-like DNA-binding protein